MRASAGTSGVTLVEVLTVSAIVLLVGVPIMTAISTSGHEAMASEDYMLAEALCQRYVHELLDLPWDELAKRLPIERKLQGVPAGDEAIARAHEEYARNLSGSESFRGTLTARRLEEGLVLIEASLEWPVRPGASSMRSLALTRMRSRPDQAIGARWALPVFRPSDDSSSGGKGRGWW